MYSRLSRERSKNKGDCYYLLLLSFNTPPIFLLYALSLSLLSFNNYNNQLTMITEIISRKIAKQTTCYLYWTVLTYCRYITYGKANKILIRKARRLSVKMQKGVQINVKRPINCLVFDRTGRRANPPQTKQNQAKPLGLEELYLCCSIQSTNCQGIQKKGEGRILPWATITSTHFHQRW